MFGGLGGPIEDVQRRLGVPATSTWDPVTMGALTAFQGSRGALPMTPHGHPDPATLINLGYYDPIEEMSPRYAAYVTGRGPKPGTLGRDIGTTTNQAPQWVWILLGVGLLGIGYASYRRTRKKS